MTFIFALLMGFNLAWADDRPPAHAASPAAPEAPAPAPAQEARDALAHGDQSKARQIATRALHSPASDTQALNAILAVASGEPAHTDVIGILLPLSGRYATVGAMLSEAIHGGFHAGHGQGKLIVMDTAGTPEGTQTAMMTLLRDKGVGAIVGPLLSESAPVASKLAEQVGVPLLILNHAWTPSPEMAWSYQAWLTLDAQLNTLVEYLVSVKEAKTFGVLAPQTPYGQAIVKAYTHAVTRLGGTLAASSFYPPDTSDFRPIAAAFVKRDQALPFRPPPGSDLPADVRGPPPLQVDVVLIADAAKRVPLVTAGLAFEEFAMGRFKPHDIAPAMLVGLSRWNHPQLIGQGGPYVSQAVFTDVFVPPPSLEYRWSPAPGWREFVDAYRALTTRTPTPSEALAWDIGLLAATLSGHAQSRWALRDLLRTAHPAHTVTGILGVDASQHAIIRDIRILSVKSDTFSIVERSPSTTPTPVPQE